LQQFFRLPRLSFGKPRDGIPFLVIARSEATKQSQKGIATPVYGGLAMTDFRVLFCHCEPERHQRSGVAIYIFIENYSGNFLFLKTEIATPAFGGLAMTEG